MNKTLKKLLRISAFALIALVVLSVSIGWFFSEQIGNRVLVEVQKSFQTELKVKDFTIELFSGFPSASLNFKEVVLKDTKGNNLLETDKISFRFGLLSLFSQEIDVKSILIDNGALLISYDKKGKPNYNVFKESQDKKASTKGLSIRKAILSDIEVIYEDAKSKKESRGVIKEATLSGAFSASKFELTSQADLKMVFVEMGTERYFAGADISYEADIAVDLDKGTYIFNQCDLYLANNQFDVQGKITTEKKATSFDLDIKGKDGSLSSIFQLLSEEQQAKLAGVKTKGKFFVNGSIKGLLSAKQNPDINFDFGIKKGKLYGGNFKDPIEDFSFTGKLVSINKKSKLTLKNIKGFIKNNRFLGHLDLKNLSDPYIDFDLKGMLPISLIYGFVGDKQETISGQGDIKISTLSLKGYYRHMTNPKKVHQVKVKGNFVVDDAGVVVNGQEIILDKGQLSFDQNKMTLKGIKVDGIGHEVHLTGYVKDYLPVIFADEHNSQKAQLKFLLSIKAKELDLKAIMAALVPETKENKSKKSTVDQKDIDLSFATFLNGDFKADIQSFSYGKIEGKNFEGRVSFRGIEVSLTGDADGMGGSFGIEGAGYLLDKPTLKTFLVLEDVDVKEFFKQTSNFGQDFLTYKSLKGDLNSRVMLETFWTKKGIFDANQLKVLAEMKINDGELRNFKMMDNFASFIKIEDLRHIKFKTLENWMEIKKGKIYIPTMEIQSNAANLLVSGQHSFEQAISYNIKVNAGKIIANKFKRKNPSAAFQKGKRKGWLNLFYTIKGTTEKFDYRMDRRGVKKAFAREDNRRRRIKRVLNKEFGGASSIAASSYSKDEFGEIDFIQPNPKPFPTDPDDKIKKPDYIPEEDDYIQFEEELEF